MIDEQILTRFRALRPGTELTLTRRFSQSAGKVFAALTVPERIEAWMGVTWTGDPAPLEVGSRFSYRFADSGMQSEGQVTALATGRSIEHTWFENMPPAHRVAWSVQPDGEGCTLTLVDTAPNPEDAPRNGAGWTMIVSQLDAWLAGKAFQAAESWRALRDRYAAGMGPRATRDGRRFDKNGRPVVRFERWIDLDLPELWAWLTRRDKLALWLGDVDIELKPGGVFKIAFQMEASWMNGAILAIDAPTHLSLIWREPWFETDAVVLDFELAPSEGGTLLTLTHTFAAGYDPHEYLPGWHEFLDGLEGAVAGHPPIDWSSAERKMNWDKLTAIYRATAVAGA